MPGSLTTPGRTSARADAPARVAFRYRNGVGTRNNRTFAAQWLACTSPCRRFAAALTGCSALSGPKWIATPSSYRTCTDYSWPVSPGALPLSGDRFV